MIIRRARGGSWSPLAVAAVACLALGLAQSSAMGEGRAPAASASDVCGAPSINAKTERAAFLWEDCDGSQRWHLRVTGGGTTVTLIVSGAIESAGGVT